MSTTVPMFFDLRTVPTDVADNHFVLPVCDITPLARKSIEKMTPSQQKFWWQLYSVSKLMNKFSANCDKLVQLGIDMKQTHLTKYTWMGRHDPFRFIMTTITNPMNLENRMKSLVDKLDAFDMQRLREREEEAAYWRTYHDEIMTTDIKTDDSPSMFSDDVMPMISESDSDIDDVSDDDV